MASFISSTDVAEKASRSAAETTGNGGLSLPSVSPVQKMDIDEEPAQTKADPVQKASMEEEPV